MKSAHDFPGGNDYEEGKEFSIDIADMPEKIRLGPGHPRSVCWSEKYCSAKWYVRGCSKV